jgi:hypothetical protein
LSCPRIWSCSVSFHDDFVEAFGIKVKLQVLRIRPPQPHSSLADLAANAVFGVILPHRIRFACKFQRQATASEFLKIRAKTGGTVLVVVFGE